MPIEGGMEFFDAAALLVGWICILLLVLLREPSCRRATKLVRSMGNTRMHSPRGTASPVRQPKPS